MQKLPKENSKHILSIGPNFQNHRGGIGALISNYAKYFETFKYISSYKQSNNIIVLLKFITCIFKLIIILIYDFDIKVIHLHGASNGSFYRKYICYFIGKKIFNKRIVYHLHGGGFENFYINSNIIIKRKIKEIIEESDCIICLSEKWEVFFKTNFCCRNLIIIPNMIDFPLIHVRPNIIDNKLKILFLGLICNNKGIFDLIDVIIKNKQLYLDKIELYVGGIGEIDRLINLITEHKIESIVKYIGWVSEYEKAKYLNYCDVYILPSYVEGLPISILEAMSYSKPIISTAVGGIPEIVIPFKNGILVEPGNLKSIENALNYCIKNKSALNKLGEESRVLVAKHLPENVIKELTQVYEKLLSK